MVGAHFAGRGRVGCALRSVGWTHKRFVYATSCPREAGLGSATRWTDEDRDEDAGGL
jgi:hypothetical protein